ncbi:hypothetical protein ACHQM5_002277 [Ranunculus cassubicifolius]
MAGKRGRNKPQTAKIVQNQEVNRESDESIDAKSTVSDAPSQSEPEIARNRLRERWELASVLNFLQVFKPVIQSKLDISSEEIEAALIKPNSDLSQLHISLLKVADGEIPLNPSQGEEVATYKELDPINRLLILKALCEVRALQEDSISYLNASLKQGTDICTFRKERIGGNATGISYWCDGDNVLGYRLYREVTNVDHTPRKGKGRLMQQPRYQWETLATNLEEFQQLSDKLSACDVGGEAAVGEIIENEIIPDLVATQKKREKALKKQQKQLMSLNGYLNSYTVGVTRSCRNRKPVKYTFDEYDKTIEEAIKEGHIDKKRKTLTEPKLVKEGNANGKSVNGDVEHDTSDKDDSTDEEDDKLKSVGGGGDSDSKSDSGDEDYNDKTDEEDNDNNRNGVKKNRTNGREKRANNRSRKTNGDADGLRRSQRLTGNGARRSNDSDSDSETISDSDNENSPESSIDKTAADGEDPESDNESASKGSADNASADGSDVESASKGSADKASADGSDNESGSKGSDDKASPDDSDGESTSKASADKASADGSDESEGENDGENESLDDGEEMVEESEEESGGDE